MTPEIFRELLSDAGQAALARAVKLAPDESAALVAITALRKHYPAELASAAVETALLRKKAAVKFSDAPRMYFLREALEVATHETLSRYRSRRFTAFSTVGDFGCGIGGDALGLATAGIRPVCVDRDPLRLLMAEANLKACGYSGEFLQRDLLADPLPDVPAAFADPNRRSEGKRFLALAEYSPPPAELLKRLPAHFPIGFKLAPGAAYEELDAFEGEIEFVSFAGELKESALWLGPLRTTAQRATILKADGTFQTMFAESPAEMPGVAPLGQYLFDPDSAVIRAKLSGNLAIALNASAIDWGSALLTSDFLQVSDFATPYRVVATVPLDARKIAAVLRGENIGRLTPLQRGAPVDIDALARGLKLRGEQHAYLLATKVSGSPLAILAQRV